MFRFFVAPKESGPIGGTNWNRSFKASLRPLTPPLGLSDHRHGNSVGLSLPWARTTSRLVRARILITGGPCVFSCTDRVLDIYQCPRLQGAPSIIKREQKKRQLWHSYQAKETKFNQGSGIGFQAVSYNHSYHDLSLTDGKTIIRPKIRKWLSRSLSWIPKPRSWKECFRMRWIR